MLSVFRFIKVLIGDFSYLLFPALCMGCNRPMETNGKVLCTSCRINMPETGQHLPPYDFALLNKFAGKVSIKFLASYVYFTKGGIVQKLIHQIKYKNQPEAAKELASWYGYQLRTESDLIHNADLLVGVPLHKSRLNQRGYNQADLIAEGLSETLGIPMRTDVLIRTRFNASQTRKNRLERWENVRTVFHVTEHQAVAGKNIILVDDVLTTGATIEACAAELLKAGCQSVGVLTIAATHR